MWFAINVLLAPYSAGIRQDLLDFGELADPGPAQGHQSALASRRQREGNEPIGTFGNEDYYNGTVFDGPLLGDGLVTLRLAVPARPM